MTRRIPTTPLRRMLEALLFVALGGVVVIRPAVLFMQYRHRVSAVTIIADEYLSILFAIIIATFPWLYRLIFGITPYEHIKLLRSRRTLFDENERASPKRVVTRKDPTELPDEIGATRDEALLRSYVESSRDIAEGLYTRAGVYLILGALIAFSGLFFFYTQTTANRDVSTANASTATVAVNNKQSTDAVGVFAERLADLAPRFGILFFIEFVAFFFLRQYRSAMEEFRYFESVKRYREESLALVCLMRDGGGAVDAGKLLESRLLFSSNVAPTPSPATGLLETGKLSKEELTLLEKIVAAIGVQRNAG